MTYALTTDDGMLVRMTDVISRTSRCGMSDQVMVLRDDLTKLTMNGLFHLAGHWNLASDMSYREIAPRCNRRNLQTVFRKAKYAKLNVMDQAMLIVIGNEALIDWRARIHSAVYSVPVSHSFEASAGTTACLLPWPDGISLSLNDG